jgi:hypothetical protein
LYAKNTEVSVEKSRAEIERTLERFGADQFSYARDDSRGLAVIQFRAKDRHIRFMLKLPERNERRFTMSKRGLRTPENAHKEWEQACRQRWRALSICIKAKLAAVEAGISEFENEFLANIVLPGDFTAGEWLRPQIEQAYLSGDAPQLLASPAPQHD